MEPMYLPPPTTCEALPLYTSGGYHPVKLSDTFSNDRYTVIHKLGYGGYATVWLARDKQQNCYVALKILTASGSTECNEFKILHKLTESKAKHLHEAHIAPLLDHFQITGPNGTHACLVLPFLGPSISSPQPSCFHIKIRPDICRKLAVQLVSAIATLHEQNLSVGDISTNNILLQVSEPAKLSNEDVCENLGQPEEFDLNVYLGRDPSDEHTPQFVYGPIDTTKLNADFLSQNVTIIDFGEAVALDEPAEAKEFGFNLNYAAPEFHFGGRKTKASDIWALACCLFELRTGTQLFSDGMSGFFGVICSMTETIGPLPSPWLEDLESKTKAMTARIERDSKTPANGGKDHSLKAKVEAVGRWWKWCYWTPEERREKLIEEMNYHGVRTSEEELEYESHRGPNPHGPLSEEECSDFFDLLSKMLKYDPAERIAIEGVLAHPWLSKSYDDVLEWTGAWIQIFDQGRADWDTDRWE